MKIKGFTIVELLVVISIIVLMTAISVAAMVSTKNRRNIDAVAEKVKNRIIQARTDSLAPQNVEIGYVAVYLKRADGSNPATLDVYEEESQNQRSFLIYHDEFDKNITFDKNKYNI